MGGSGKYPCERPCLLKGGENDTSTEKTARGGNGVADDGGDGRLAYWTLSDTNTGGAPCSDINVINQNRSTNVTGAYKSGSTWIAGSLGWLFGPQYELIPVITSIGGSGIPFRTGSAVGNTLQRQLS
jgi:hypothetical protein